MATMFQTMIANMQGQPIDLLRNPVSAGPAPSSASFISGLSSVVGGLSAIYKGKADRSRAYLEAQQMSGEAAQEELAGKREAILLLRQLNGDLGSITAAGAASGIGFGGSLVSAENQSMKIGMENLSISRANSKAKVANIRAGATQLRAEGDIAKAGGYGDAAMIGFENFRRIARRG